MTTQVGTATGLEGPSDKASAPTASAAAGKMIYRFGKGTAEGDASQRELLGGKGANLAEMSTIGLPVPPGFTITTRVCADYHEAGEKLPAGLMDQVRESAVRVRRLSAAHQHVRRRGHGPQARVLRDRLRPHQVRP
jgi:hypothetical protein